MTPTCPHCGMVFHAALANADHLPVLALMLCEGCAELSLLKDGAIVALLPGELEQIKKSPAWRDMLEPIQKAIRKMLKGLS